MWETTRVWDCWLKRWVCEHCNRDPGIKYISTGHDHTDYSYHLCSCAGAKANGKHEDDLN
jgi:hypothetical protein